MSPTRSKRLPVKDLISEDRAPEPASSQAKQPYLRLAMARPQDRDTTLHLEKIAHLA